MSYTSSLLGQRRVRHLLRYGPVYALGLEVMILAIFLYIWNTR